jgi:hypothetical protein
MSMNARVRKHACTTEYNWTVLFSSTPLASLVSSFAAFPFIVKAIAQTKQDVKQRPAIKKRKFGRDHSEKTPYFKAIWKVSLPKKYENSNPFN